MRKLSLVAAAAAIAAVFGIAKIATAAAAAKTETLSIILTSNTSDIASAIGTGAFTAGGTVALSGGSKGLTVHFTGGTFKLLKTGTSKSSALPPKACLYSKEGSGTYKLADGTGAYKGISGSGKFSSTSRQVYPSIGGKCGSKPAATQFVITASGPVSLP
jgi:hypothetical protein